MYVLSFIYGVPTLIDNPRYVQVCECQPADDIVRINYVLMGLNKQHINGPLLHRQIFLEISSQKLRQNANF